VIELKRPPGKTDLLRWYCARDGEVVWEAPFTLQNIAVDLKQIMERFWSDPALRRCKRCGTLVEKPAATGVPAAK
jgi:3-hydroxyanthranilate 3,4-dioxygenase